MDTIFNRDGCFYRALDDEPVFVLLARDPCAAEAVRWWVTLRQALIGKGEKPLEDHGMLADALSTAQSMHVWRADATDPGQWPGRPRWKEVKVPERVLVARGEVDKLEADLAACRLELERADARIAELTAPAVAEHVAQRPKVGAHTLLEEAAGLLGPGNVDTANAIYEFLGQPLLDRPRTKSAGPVNWEALEADPDTFVWTIGNHFRMWCVGPAGFQPSVTWFLSERDRVTGHWSDAFPLQRSLQRDMLIFAYLDHMQAVQHTVDTIRAYGEQYQTLEWMGHPVKPLSPVRLCELLDYATVYGDWDQHTLNGTMHSLSGEPMNNYRRVAIITLKRALGLLPEDYQWMPNDTDPEWKPVYAHYGEAAQIANEIVLWVGDRSNERAQEVLRLAERVRNLGPTPFIAYDLAAKMAVGVRQVSRDLYRYVNGRPWPHARKAEMFLFCDRLNGYAAELDAGKIAAESLRSRPAAFSPVFGMGYGEAGDAEDDARFNSVRRSYVEPDAPPPVHKGRTADDLASQSRMHRPGHVPDIYKVFADTVLPSEETILGVLRDKPAMHARILGKLALEAVAAAAGMSYEEVSRIYRGAKSPDELQAQADAELIPPGVYYGIEGSNFYDLVTNAGKGDEFYAKWRHRVDEFPKRVHDEYIIPSDYPHDIAVPHFTTAFRDTMRAAMEDTPAWADRRPLRPQDDTRPFVHWLGTYDGWGVYVAEGTPPHIRSCIASLLNEPCGPGGMGRGLEA